MREIAKIFSNGMDYIRVDFYSINSKIYIGELTLYPGSGFIKFEPAEIDLRYGQLLQLKGLEKK